MTAVIERAELHKTIWRTANGLRGSVDGWDFKSYVLGSLSYCFISENLTGYMNATEREAIIVEGGTPEEIVAFDYATFSNEDTEAARNGIVKEKGFFIRPSDLFGNVRAQVASDENLDEALSYAFRLIENPARGSGPESDLRGLFDDVDANSTKLGNAVAQRNAKLVKIMDAVGDLFFGHGAAQIDALGDVYEYLVTMYASSAGESGGEFCTLQEAAEAFTTLVLDGRSGVMRVYDSRTGSGSLPLKFVKLLGPSSSRQYSGQEINLTTYNLCRISMLLYDVNFSSFDIALGDTLTEPARWGDQPLDVTVSNPPYSMKWVGKNDTALINDPRFASAGVLAPKSKASLAFIMRMLHWLVENETAAIVELLGVPYCGAAERKIRRYLVGNDFVHAMIQLPPDLFFGTMTATCITVFRKARLDHSALFVDVSAECVREGSKNRLTAENQRRILFPVSERQAVDHMAALVSIDDAKDNGWNLLVSSYVEPEDTREQVDIVELNPWIAGVVERQRHLRASIDVIVAELEADR